MPTHPSFFLRRVAGNMKRQMKRRSPPRSETHSSPLATRSTSVRTPDSSMNPIARANSLPSEPLTTPLRTPEDRFDDYLQSRGMRNTQQRRHLLNLAFKQPSYFDADQLMEQLPSRGQPDYVSRPTVYRTLNEFVDAGLLKRFELEGRAVYQPESGVDQHDHFFCNECRKLSELKSPELSRLVTSIAAEGHFQVHSHRLVVKGICAECRQNRRRTKRRVDLI